MKQLSQCPCGKTSVEISGKPITRMVCHCQTCQAFNQTDFADVTLFLSKDVTLNDEASVSFASYQSPPVVQRGKCIHCQAPAIEKLTLPLNASITLIPSALIAPGKYLPKISGHIFYHRRVNPVNDAVTKVSGFLKSQLFVGAKVFAGISKKVLPFTK